MCVYVDLFVTLFLILTLVVRVIFYTEGAVLVAIAQQQEIILVISSEQSESRDLNASWQLVGMTAQTSNDKSLKSEGDDLHFLLTGGIMEKRGVCL